MGRRHRPYGQLPKQVATAANVLKDAVQHYVFVSTISVYPAFGAKAGTIDETAETAPMPDPMPENPMHAYGANKAASERAAEAIMPGRVSNVPPGLIVGPRDRSDRFTYWPMRLDAGGDVLAPGDGTGQIQLVDVRDLGAWLVHLCETRAAGVFNALGFDGVVTMADLVHGCKCATTTPSTVHWVPDPFLEAQKARPWRDFPLYLPASGRTIVSNERAIKAGLTFRPLADTIRDTLAWARTKRGDRPMERGISPTREAKILEAWSKRGDVPSKDDDAKIDGPTDR